MKKKLSIIMPVFNEEGFVLASIKRVLATKIGKLTTELIVVNDGSTDGTREKLRKIRDRRLVLVEHSKNYGKGKAVRTGIGRATGDLLVIQDADLEYDPAELPLLISPIIDGRADVVFGSRFVGSGPHRVLYFWHRLANFIVTTLCDAFCNLNLTDVETGYKAFTREVARRIELQENGFSFDPEFTIKVARNNFRIYEVGVSYSGRSYAEGKKICWKDGIIAIWTIIKYSLFK